MTIANVPSGLTSEMNQFLKAVKNQVELREGLRPNARDQRFLSIKDIQSLIDDHSVRTEKGKERVGKIQEGEKVNLNPLLSKIRRLDVRLESIESRRILNLQIKEGVFVNTFIHVGENDPSDEAWKPIGTGIHAEGIYSVNGAAGSETGKFLLASKEVNPLSTDNALYPYLGTRIWPGEFRVGDDIRYQSGNELEGNDWLWYNPTYGMKMKLTTGEITLLRAGGHYIKFTDYGMLGYNASDQLRFGLTIRDTLTGHHPSGTAPAGSAFFAGDVILGNYQGGTGIFFNSSANTIHFNGVDLDMFGGSITISQVSDAGELAEKDSISYSEVTGTKPPTNATHGATWESTLFSIPDRFSNSAATGLNITASYLGYYTGSEWRSYIDNQGRFQFKGNDNHMIQWNGITGSLYISGRLIVQNTSEVQPTLTAYNTLGAGNLNSSAAMIVYGDIDLRAGSNILFPNAALYSSGTGLIAAAGEWTFTNTLHTQGIRPDSQLATVHIGTNSYRYTDLYLWGRIRAGSSLNTSTIYRWSTSAGAWVGEDVYFG